MNQSPKTALFTFLALDPRKGVDQLPSEQWARTLGLEVTSGPLAAACGLGNVDPQHGFGTVALAVNNLPEGDPLAACNAALVCRLSEAGATLAFLKPDVDSVLAAAVLVLRALEIPVLDGGERQARLRLVAERDGFNPGGEWRPRPLPTTAAIWADGAAPVEESESLAPLGVICSPVWGSKQPQLPLGERVAVTACWLLYGPPEGGSWYGPGDTVGAPDQIAAACGAADSIGRQLSGQDLAAIYERAALAAYYARMETARAVESGEARPRLVQFNLCGACGWLGEIRLGPGDIPMLHCPECYASLDGQAAPPGEVVNLSVVDYGSRGALGLGYCLAPVVVATGLPVEGGGRKYTIAAWSARYVNFPALLAELNAAEAHARGITAMTDRWGGNLTSGIIGSPQGTGSVLALDAIVAMVAKHQR